MDITTVLLLVLLIAAIVVVTFAVLRSRQRSGSVLAAPDSAPRVDGSGSQQ